MERWTQECRVCVGSARRGGENQGKCVTTGSRSDVRSRDESWKMDHQLGKDSKGSGQKLQKGDSA